MIIIKNVKYYNKNVYEFWVYKVTTQQTKEVSIIAYFWFYDTDPPLKWKSATILSYNFAKFINNNHKTLQFLRW